MPAIGGFTFQQFPARSHGYADGMNHNMIKAATLLQPSVISRTTALPVTANDHDCYIDPANGLICTWLDGEWYKISPSYGAWVHVQDAEEYAHFGKDNLWITALDLNAVHTPIERTLAFYNPGIIRPNATLFYYVAAMEFTIPANAPGTAGLLEVAPTGGSVQFDIFTSSGVSGNIAFADGSTAGVVTFPAQVVVHPSEEDTSETMAHHLFIRAPSNTLGAEGLSITIRGEIRAID